MSGEDAGFDSMAQFTGTIAGDVRDPYPALRTARERCPVELVDGSSLGAEAAKGSVLNVYSFDDVTTVLRDSATYDSSGIRKHIGQVMGDSVLVGLDGEEHLSRRRLISAAFRPRSLARWDVELVQPTINRLIDSFAGRNHAELVGEFTYQFPVHIIAGILGVPEIDHAVFRDDALAVVSFSADPARGMAAAARLREYFGERIDRARVEPGNDLIGHLVESELDGERLSEAEILSFLLFLLPAGVETTYRATGNLLFGLLSNPDQLSAVRANHELLDAAVEEALRWEPPMVMIPRTTSCPASIGGVSVPAGTEVSYFIGSANREASRWVDPDRFDITRDQRSHMAFGFGAHYCLGVHLARMEMRAATMALLDRLPNLRFAPDADELDAHIHGDRFRSPTLLPVVFGT